MIGFLTPAVLALSLQPDTEDYAALTNPFRDATNFNVETVKGMVVDDGKLYSLNTHGSRIVVHDLASAQAEPIAVWTTVQNPVTIAAWEGDLLVVGGATRALVRHSAADGRVTALVDLPSEPGDLVVDAAGERAFVASQAENAVVEIDLATFTETQRFDLPVQRPRFLFLEYAGDPPAPRLFVAPMLSGNGSAHDARSGVVPDIALSDPALALGDVHAPGQVAGIPDEDLFVIDLGSPTPAAIPAATGVGTLLLEHARNPSTNQYWVLGVESHNALPNQDTEFELRGIFADNQLAILPASAGSGLSTPIDIIDLDDTTPGDAQKDYVSSRSVSFPYALAFQDNATRGSYGFGAVASSTGDIVVFLEPDGDRVLDHPLPEGSIPRDLLVDHSGSESVLHVYCWGTNEVRSYLFSQLGVTNPQVVVRSLGDDPAPAAVQRGREIWYDAHRSLDGRTTCNTCHPDVGMDLLAWNLSDTPVDHKSLMVTQSLRSIVDTPNYHWRGERSLQEFNGAFSGLLGSPSGDLDTALGGELDDFVEFVFSVQGQANSFQNPDRVLDDALTRGPFTKTDSNSQGPILETSPEGDAPEGQDLFLTHPSFGPPIFDPEVLTCADCHTLPGGTSGHAAADVSSVIPTNINFEATHLRQLNHKVRQDIVAVTLPQSGDPSFRTRLGFGISHNGMFDSLFDFVDQDAFSLNAQEAASITSFIMQFDQGLAPRAHAAMFMRQANASQIQAAVAAQLLDQALPAKRWIDVVAFGRATVGGVGSDVRMLYDPASNRFVLSNGWPTQSLAQLAALVSAGVGDLVFLGLPPGDGRRFALDPDDDMLTDVQELAEGTDPLQPDSDGDGWEDGYEVANGADPTSVDTVTDVTAPNLVGPVVLDHVQATFAKLFLETNEPTRVRVQARIDGGPLHGVRTQALRRRHTIVLPRLDASVPGSTPNSYGLAVEIFDQQGNPLASPVTTFEMGGTVQSSFQTDEIPTVPQLVEVTGLEFLVPPAPGTGGAWTFNAEFTVAQEQGAPFAAPVSSRVVVAQVATRASETDEWQISDACLVVSNEQLAGPLTLRVPQQTGSIDFPYTLLPAPFLLPLPTDANGQATVLFDVLGLNGSGCAPAPLASGNQVRISVLGVLATVEDYNPTTPILTFESLSHWKMPSTDPASRGVTFTIP